MATLISLKTKRIMSVILVAFLGLVLRIWHLCFVQREERLYEAHKPQQRTILLHADRGTIYDRFGIPLALNRICYNAAIYYGQIAQIPMVIWKRDSSGKQVKTYARKEYIHNLAQILSETLHLDPERVEDQIHSKASLFPHVPFILKGSLTEEEHYKLRMLEKEWPGIYAEIGAERHYPLGKTACNILGSLGPINQKEYSLIAQEISELQAAIDLDQIDANAYRLAELKEKAYSINDLVGKSGIEAQFEEELRGFSGKKIFEVDRKGNFVREINGVKEPIAGKKINLTISAELQQFAESLLAQDEKVRDGRSVGLDPDVQKQLVQKQPWIKGGAIAVFDPKTGDVLALASQPRFNPNDFIPIAGSVFNKGKTRQSCRWLENLTFIGSVWDGKDSLLRERSRLFQEERQPLTWDFYLDTILAQESPLRRWFNIVDDLRGAIQVQEDFETLLYFSKLEPLELLRQIFDGKTQIADALGPQRRIESVLASIPSHEDKLMAIDLCRMAVYSPAFTDSLIEKVGGLKLSKYRSLCQTFLKEDEEERQKGEEWFRKTQFRAWRDLHQKEFLAEKRKEEKEKRTYAKPYIDYLDKKEKELFHSYWKEKRFEVFCNRTKDPLLQDEDLLRTFRSFTELSRPLLGKYRRVRNWKKEQTEMDLAASFYPMEGFGFNRSFAYQAGVPLGSVFKLVTGYEGLRQGVNLSIIDEWSPKGVGYQLNKTPYPRIYKGGRLPRSASRKLGLTDLKTAIERSSNPYFSILAGDYFEDPEDLARVARLFGFGAKTGIELPGEAAGNVPRDLKTNRTGLYSMAIGQHTLLTTPLQAASMLATLVNGGKVLRPKIIDQISGFTPDREPLGPFSVPNYLAKNELSAIGIHFPLFTGVQPRVSIPDEPKLSIEITRSIPMNSFIRSSLLEGMDRVVWGAKGSARPGAIKALLANPIWKKDYVALEHQMIGKTGTAEIALNLSINPSSSAQIYKYIWFGAISLENEEPELAIAVFLRYGDSGKEAAPLAAQIIQKWREIKKRAHNSDPKYSPSLKH